MNQYEIDYKQGYDNANDEWLERIEKIRAEIMSKDGLEEALEIIDKYKAESEDKE